MSGTERILIGVDWGGTRLRASLMEAATGYPIDSREERESFRQGEAAYRYLADFLSDWFREWQGAPVLLCGMVTSREGWQDAGYVDCPEELDRLADNCAVTERDGRRFYFVPGMRSAVPHRACHDLMRGEETQILGLMGDDDAESRTICLPGTHSKWAVLEGRKLTRFQTFMTGEVHDILRRYSILRHSVQGTGNPGSEAFLSGLKAARDNGSFLSGAFLIRAQEIGGELSKNAASDYLSGLLVGLEVSEVLKFTGPCHVSLVAAGELSRVYNTALVELGFRVSQYDGDLMTRRGLWRIACKLGLAGETA